LDTIDDLYETAAIITVKKPANVDGSMVYGLLRKALVVLATCFKLGLIPIPFKHRTFKERVCQIYGMQQEYEKGFYEEMQSAIQDEIGLSAEQCTDYILQRFYRIKRITPIISALHEFQQHLLTGKVKRMNSAALFSPQCASLFVHPRTKQLFNEIYGSGTVRPLLHVWRAYGRYTWCHEPTFNDEFIRLSCMVACAALLHLEGSHADQFVQDTLARARAATDFDVCCDLLEAVMRRVKSRVRTHKKKVRTSPDVMTVRYRSIDAMPWKPFLPIRYREYVGERFYQEHRLASLYQFHKQVRTMPHTLRLSCATEHGDTVTLEGVSFRNARVVAGVKQLCATKKLTALDPLWSDFFEYRDVNDEQFGREFILVLCLVYRVLFAVGPPQHKASLTGEVFDVYQDVSSLPLEQALDLLDVMVDQIPNFLERVHFFSDLGWRQWLKKYWWAVPLFGCLLYYRFSHIFDRTPLCDDGDDSDDQAPPFSPSDNSSPPHTASTPMGGFGNSAPPVYGKLDSGFGGGQSGGQGPPHFGGGFGASGAPHTTHASGMDSPQAAVHEGAASPAGNPFQSFQFPPPSSRVDRGRVMHTADPHQYRPPEQTRPARNVHQPRRRRARDRSQLLEGLLTHMCSRPGVTRSMPRQPRSAPASPMMSARSTVFSQEHSDVDADSSDGVDSGDTVEIRDVYPSSSHAAPRAHPQRGVSHWVMGEWLTAGRRRMMRFEEANPRSVAPEERGYGWQEEVLLLKMYEWCGLDGRRIIRLEEMPMGPH